MYLPFKLDKHVNKWLMMGLTPSAAVVNIFRDNLVLLELICVVQPVKILYL